HAAVLELARVAKEVRIFPLLALGGLVSPFVDGCSERLRIAGYRVSIESVPYEFQRGGNQMMRFRRSSLVSSVSSHTWPGDEQPPVAFRAAAGHADTGPRSHVVGRSRTGAAI